MKNILYYHFFNKLIKKNYLFFLMYLLKCQYLQNYYKFLQKFNCTCLIYFLIAKSAQCFPVRT